MQPWAAPPCGGPTLSLGSTLQVRYVQQIFCTPFPGENAYGRSSERVSENQAACVDRGWRRWHNPSHDCSSTPRASADEFPIRGALTATPAKQDYRDSR